MSEKSTQGSEMLYDFFVDERFQVEEQHQRIAKYIRTLKHQNQHLLVVSRRCIRHSRKLLRIIKSPSMRNGAIGCDTRDDVKVPTYHFHSQLLAEKISASFELSEDEMKQVTNRQLAMYQFSLNHRLLRHNIHLHLVGRSHVDTLTGESHLH